MICYFLLYHVILFKCCIVLSHIVLPYIFKRYVVRSRIALRYITLLMYYVALYPTVLYLDCIIFTLYYMLSDFIILRCMCYTRLPIVLYYTLDCMIVFNNICSPFWSKGDAFSIRHLSTRQGDTVRVFAAARASAECAFALSLAAGAVRVCVFVRPSLPLCPVSEPVSPA